MQLEFLVAAKENSENLNVNLGRIPQRILLGAGCDMRIAQKRIPEAKSQCSYGKN
jgi:hypothetical protein